MFFPRKSIIVSFYGLAQWLKSCKPTSNANGKRIRDAALYTFIYHYTFAAKSKSIII